ncbi:PREDICTED: protein SRG1-like [Brassica oleracea var. oleracea]|uniref:Fe2OG dioxygenase domain-containing protein n=1 Tax=Brassica oleracea var. oleracea TaxID=109376 RepID=A0A0D3CAX1_BRAOL|nr:PREDICTED: protein SRG1-like [Brassica oleracea var. oleracea]XP_013585332.1 PREDICTED: protein SRG1-like [Brassica oleracea var. oleracea]
MEAKGETQWSSIIVPSVQEMVEEKVITTVPPRYVQSDQDKSGVTDDSGLIPDIPVIDMKRLCSSAAKDSDYSEVQKLDLACKEFGFFQLVNHGIDPTFLDKTKLETHDLFSLPMEEKKKFWQKPDEMEGFGQAFVLSEDQKLDWADIFFFTMQPAQLRKPHLFPKLPLPFRDTLEMYSAQVKSIAKILIAKMGEALEIKPEEIEERFGDDMFQSMRMNYYPPCPEPNQVIGLTPHSDAVALTILLQVNDVEGLQIKKDGKWVFVKPLPNAFIVNVGDVLEIITNGIYKSIEHRVVVNSEKERLSFATFHNPGLNKEISPAKSPVEKRKKRAKFKSLITKDYLKGLFSRELYGKAYLDAMRI